MYLLYAGQALIELSKHDSRQQRQAPALPKLLCSWTVVKFRAQFDWIVVKKIILAICLIGWTALGGCARSYVITLDNGRHITTASKPKLRDGKYVFKDASGKEAYVGQGRVREIVPVSMAQEQKQMFNPQPGSR
jgi:hypothetical protein